ncbi:inorganic pyrophosphatase [Corynascus novoguineensis]|uniref:Inorganic pyrophosphatase n=1 Tax=Corynascus novoguineensis TaxID=1126955 RepID=A0AAN7CPP3_9PEZI|nr:inorganic pyrophosphatase [Corynascus novoguineensis]
MEISQFSTTKKGEYKTRRSGRPFSKDFRIHFERAHDGIPVSPFHDIPLYHDREKGILNMVVEIPRWSNAKFEISREKSLNPIVQDTLDGKPRFVKNCFPYKGYIWNYGALPQTWENPNYKDPDTGTDGDNDPLDACEIGRTVHEPGAVRRVQVLGILGLLDEGQTDWKVLMIDADDPLARSGKLRDLADVERYLPGLLDATRDWFGIYKVPDGKPPNKFAFRGEWKDKRFAEKIIEECRDAWKKLVNGKIKPGNISLDNTTLHGTPGRMDPDKVHLPPQEDLSPAPVERDLEEWFYVDREPLKDQEPSFGKSSLTIVVDMQE